MADACPWDNKAHGTLCLALVDVLVKPGKELSARKDAIVAGMTFRGQKFSWDEIR